MAIKTKLAVLATALTLSISALSANAAQTLRIGTLAAYAPFEYVDSKTGKYEGFDIDLIQEILKREGYDAKIVSMSLDGLIPALISNNIDIAISALTITPERAERVDFSDPYMNAGLTVITNKANASKIKSLKDLEGKTLCAEIGSAGAMLSKTIKGTKIRTFNSTSDAFLELNRNTCYAMLNDGPANSYFLTTKAGKAMNLKALDWVVSNDYYGIAVNKGNAKMLDIVNKGLRSMMADGTYDKLYKKWFGTYPSQSKPVADKNKS